MRAPVVALVGVEPHLAVAERAERLAVGIDLSLTIIMSFQAGASPTPVAPGFGGTRLATGPK